MGTNIIWFVAAIGGIVAVIALAVIAFGGMGVGTWQLSNGKHTRDQANYMDNVVAPAAAETLHDSTHWDPGEHH